MSRLAWLAVLLAAGCGPTNRIPLLRALEGHKGGITHGALSADGSRALSYGCHTVRLWDVGAGKELQCRKLDYSVLHLAFTPRGALAFTGDGVADEALRVWDVETGKLLRCFPEPVSCAAVSADGRWVLGGHGRRSVGQSNLQDCCVRVWDLESGRELAHLTGLALPVEKVALSTDGRRVIAADLGGDLYVWDLESGQLLQRLIHAQGGDPTQVAFSPDGRYALADRLGDVCLWNVGSGEEVRRFSPPAAAPKGRRGDDYLISTKAFLPDGRRALFGLSNRERTVIPPPPVVQPGRPRRSYTNLTLVDFTIVLRDLRTGAELSRSDPQDYALECLAVAADGRRALFARFKTLQVWGLPP
jgi:WD40 repeat protein